jgi:hypothetical protein
VSGPWCVVREQQDEYLVYNPRTDELHLISPLGRYVYLLCDGLRTAAQIQALLPGPVAVAVPEYLGQLLARGLLELADVPSQVGGSP